MVDDTTWLDQAIRLFDDLKARQSTTFALKAALCFAAAEARAEATRQPREITEAMIEAHDRELFRPEGSTTRAALEAAEKAR